MVSDYQLTLIIITIIGFIISTAFYIYFVYLPASRIESQINTIAAKGSDLIDVVNTRAPVIEEEFVETLTSICTTIQNIICEYNQQEQFTGFGCFLQPPTPCPNKCALTSQAYPAFCNSLVAFPESCNGCPH